MKITLEEMREVGKHLPIGYYLGRKTPVLIEEGDRAYCDVVKGDIHIGIELLQMAATNIQPADAKKWDREAMLRCLLYHKISHLLLTPKNFEWLRLTNPKTNAPFSEPDCRSIFNIFEDERIEQTLADKFIGVDFKAFVKLVNGNSDSQPESDVSKIFHAIRFRETTQEISDQIDTAIQCLVGCTATKGYGPFTYRDYVQDIVNEILKNDKEEEKDENKKDKDEKDKNEKGKNGDKKDEGNEDEGNNDEDEKQSEEEQQSEEEDENTDKENSDDGNEDENEEDGDGDSEKSPTHAHSANWGKINSPDAKALAAEIFIEPTSEVSNAINRFASRLAKKRGTVTAGCWSGLHGRIETKRDAMDKEKIFRRKNDVGESLMSSVNLTLWIDHSGSFHLSKDAINKILVATSRAVTSSQGKLSVNVVKMDTNARLANPTEWAVDPQGDSDVDISYVVCWEKTRRKNYRNIDIVVFDGMCSYSAWHAKHKRMDKAMEYYSYNYIKKIWNSPDCWILSDTSNKELFNHATPKAHRTYMTSGYAEALQSKVIEILDRIL